MPSHKVHACIDRLLLGKVYWQVHEQMDFATPFLHQNHRVFGHDPGSASAIAWNAYPEDVKAQLSAVLHIVVDIGCSTFPVVRWCLEWLAETDFERRMQAQKNKSFGLAKWKVVQSGLK